MPAVEVKCNAARWGLPFRAVMRCNAALFEKGKRIPFLTMKQPQFFRPLHHIEVLEHRIAPAAVLHIFDQDGDAITVTSNKGILADLQTAVGVNEGGMAADVLSFQLGAIFKGAEITVTAGATATDAITTRVGFVNAEGIDLGKLTIDGELDRLKVGDSNSATPAIHTILVGSWGDGTLPAALGQFDSEVIGAINTLTVKGDFNGAYLTVAGSDSFDPFPSLHLTDVHGKIGTLFIGGSLLGTAREDGGHIFTTGDITRLTVVGSVKGFEATNAPLQPPTDQNFNGRIFSGGKITTLLMGTDAVDGNLVGGDGAFSGQIVGVDGITNVTVKGNIQGGIGLESGAIGAAGTLGTVMVTKSLVGDVGDRSGTILGFTSINNVKIGGNIEGGSGFNSGAIGAGSIFSSIPGVVQIGTVVVTGDIIGGAGASSGQIVSQGTIKNVTVRNLIGGSEFESGSIGSLKGLGPILVTGSITAGTGERSGLITTEEAPDEGGIPDADAPIASVTVLGSITAGRAGFGAGGILSSGKLGPVVVGGNVVGGDNTDTGRIHSSSGITSVKIGGSVIGGDGGGSGSIRSSLDLGPVTIGSSTSSGNLLGGGGVRSGSVLSGGKLAKIDVWGNVAGDEGAGSGSIETQGEGLLGNMGAVFIAKSLIGGFGSSGAVDSGQIFSSGKLASVVIGDPKDSDNESGSVIGGIALGSGTISSELDMGPVKIKRDLQGGTGDESGKITSGGKIASLTIGSETFGGSIDGGEGNYDTTIEAGAQLGQVFAEGTIGPVVVFGNVSGNAIDPEGGAYSGQIRGLSIASVTIHGSLNGGLGDYSGGLYATSLNIGPVVIANNLQGGGGFGSGFISAEGNLSSVKIGNSLLGGDGSGSGYVAAGGNLTTFEADFASGNSESSRPRISAGKLISSVTINGSIFNTDILAGYNTSGFGFNPDAQIGTVKIGTFADSETESGTMQGTNIVAGISARGDGYFGTSDDQPLSGTDKPAIYSKIASVIVKGSIINTSNSGDTFGIVAQHLVSVKVGGSPLSLTAGARNNHYQPTGLSSDTVYGEVTFD